MEADARTTAGIVVTPQVITAQIKIITATAGTDVVQLSVDNNDRILVVDE